MSKIIEYLNELHVLTNETDFQYFNPTNSYSYISKLTRFSRKKLLPSFVVTTDPNGTEITRAVNYNKDGDYLNIQDFGPAPSDKINKPGRANFIGQSIFYCSEMPGTSLFEVRPKGNGEYIGLITLKIDRSLKLMSFGLMDQYDFSNDIKFDERDIAVNQFFGEKFKEYVPEGEEHLYYPTAIISNLFYKNDIDGLLIPSVASNLKAENIVLKPSIDNIETIVDLRIVKVYDYCDSTNFKTKCVKKCETKEGDNLIWDKISCSGHHISENIYE